MKQLTLNETAAFLLANDDYVILTHRRPDGDTIGCAAALCGGLRRLGKRASVLENPQFTEKYRFLLEGLTCPELYASACVLSVDVAAESQLPYGLPECAVELLIDHHERNSGYALQGYVEPEAAACGEIVLRLLQEMQVPADRKVAEALYVAVSTDTGCFRYSNTTGQHPAGGGGLQGLGCGYLCAEPDLFPDQAPGTAAVRGSPHRDDGILRRGQGGRQRHP